MTTDQIAEKLIAYCRRNDFTGAQKELFSTDAVSIEPEAYPPFEKETIGLDRILEKGEKWDAMIKETHHLSVSDPLTAENCFTIALTLDVSTHDGRRMNISELCVYK